VTWKLLEPAERVATKDLPREADCLANWMRAASATPWSDSGKSVTG